MLQVAPHLPCWLKGVDVVDGLVGERVMVSPEGQTHQQQLQYRQLHPEQSSPRYCSASLDRPTGSPWVGPGSRVQLANRRRSYRPMDYACLLDATDWSCQRISGVKQHWFDHCYSINKRLVHNKRRQIVPFKNASKFMYFVTFRK